MRESKKKLLIITGEISGEKHAASLLRELLGRRSDLEVSAMGGRLLEKEGAKIIYSYEEISVTGLTEVFLKIPSIWKAERTVKRYIEKERPSIVILVDFPGFNLRIASFLKRFSIPVIYFIPPQIWAWGEKRIKMMKEYVNRVICILPFEKALYDIHGIDCIYAGHPYVNSLKSHYAESREFFRAIGADGKIFITFMPGSRKNEVKRHMPFFAKLFPLLRAQIRDCKFLIPVAENLEISFVEKYLKEKQDVYVFKNLNIDALKYSNLAILSSGSAVLEALMLQTPSIVIYKLSMVSYIIAKRLVKTNYVSIPNILAKKEVFPEFIQYLDPPKIAEKALFMLKNEERTREELMKIKKEFGNFDTYNISAEAVIEILEKDYATLY